MYQQHASEDLCDCGMKTCSGKLGFFSPYQWLMLQYACNTLLPFEEATNMVNCKEVWISNTISLVFLLEYTY